ncbi:unnamed protein product [Scytosiphon promiscuus]
MEDKQAPLPDGQDIADGHEEETEPGRGEEKTATSRASRDPAHVEFEEDADVPFDDATLRGELSNGMEYYVRANRHPRERAELRIAIKVGSVMETEEERGVAHLIEHLAFRASRTCPQEFDLVKEASLITLLESHGIKFGAHQNAYTSFEETVYELHVPADQPVLLERSLRVLRQLALEVRLSDDDVERERSIVVEEWRQGRGCAQRATEDFFKLVVKGSLFEERLPIGLMSVIKTVPAETVRAFYARHYHPERMAVVAVGDFADGGKGVVELVKSVFEACPRGDREKPSPVGVPTHYDVRAAVFADSEATSSSMVLEVKQASSFCSIDALPLKTHGDYRREVAEDLFHACLNARLSKTAMRDRPPFLTASSSTPVTVAALSTVQLMVTALDGGLPRAMRAVLTEVHRIKIHGFSDREVSIAKKNHLAEVRGEWVARDQTDSTNLCSDYVEYFLRDNPAPGIGWEAGVLAPLLETVGTEDVNEIAERFSWGKNTVVFATCPTPGRLARLQTWLSQTVPLALSSSVLSPIRTSLLGSIFPSLDGKQRIRFGDDNASHLRTAGATTLGGTQRLPLPRCQIVSAPKNVSFLPTRATRDDRVNVNPLEVEDLLPDYLAVGDQAVEPAGDLVALERVLGPGEGEIQVHELTLANGMQVSYKCTDFCDDEVLFSGIAHGGRTELSPERAPSALMSVTVAEELGIFGVKPSKAMDMLTGKRVSLGLSIEAYDREASGSCAAADLEAALQLLHLLFVAELRWDEGRLETVLSYVEEHVRNQNKDPQERLMGLINQVNTQGHPFYASPSLALLAKVDPRWAATYFKSQFRNPAAFRFVFVGTLDPSEAVPLLHKYLGSIPVPKALQGAKNVSTVFSSSGGGTPGESPEDQDGRGPSVVRPWEEPLRSRDGVTPLDVRFPPNKVTKVVRVPMGDPYAVSTITFPVALGGPRHPTHAERLRDNILIQFASSVLETRLNEVLRFTLGRTYGVSVQDSFLSAPPMLRPDQPLPGTVMITLSCEPQELPLLRATTLSELKRLQELGPREDEIKGAVEADRRDRETAERTNAYWLHTLSMQYQSPRYQGDIGKAYSQLVSCRSEVRASLSPETLREAYVHFFGDLQRRTEVSLLPQRRWKTAGRYAAMGALVAGVLGAGAMAVTHSRRAASRAAP